MILFEKIIQLLKESGVWYEVLEHEPVFTSEQAAAVRPDITLGQGAKAMVLKVQNLKISSTGGSAFGGKDQNEIPGYELQVTSPKYIMVVLPGDRKIDYKKVTKFLGVKDVTLASPEEVEGVVGVKIGAVSPFGNLSGLSVLVDRLLLENSAIAFNAGDHGKTVIMKSSDFQPLSKSTVGDFTKTS